MRRIALLKRMLRQFGLEDERVRLEWASAAEGPKFAATVAEMTEAIRKLGPLNWKKLISSNGHLEPVAEPEEVAA
jgi:F420-non-reducing hydrogenase iron-sulfur subunit